MQPWPFGKIDGPGKWNKPPSKPGPSIVLGKPTKNTTPRSAAQTRLFGKEQKRELGSGRNPPNPLGLRCLGFGRKKVQRADPTQPRHPSVLLLANKGLAAGSF